MIKKSVYLIFLVSLTMASNAQEEPLIHSPSPQAIAQYEKETQAEMTKRRRVRMLSRIAAVGVVLSECYQLYTYFSSDDHTVLPYPPEDGADQTWYGWLASTPQRTKKFLTSGNTWRTGGLWVANVAALVLVERLVEHVALNYFNKQNAQWFFVVKTMGSLLIHELTAYAQDTWLITRSKDAHDRYCTQVLIKGCNELITRIERLLGYMHYKVHSIDKQHYDEAQSIIAYVTTVSTAFAHEMSAQLMSETIVYQQTADQLRAFQLVLEREIVHFSRLEEPLTKKEVYGDEQPA